MINCLASAVNYWAQHHSDNMALKDASHEYSYGELDELTDKWARNLLDMGLVNGDHICWLGKNSAHYFAMLVAATKAGVVMAPIGWRLVTGEVRYVLEDTGARILFTDEEFLQLSIKATENLENVKIIVNTAHHDGHEHIGQWGEGASDLSPINPHDAALQLYTSGTTGQPKGAVLSNHNMFCMRDQLDPIEHLWAKMAPQDMQLAIMPIAHIAGTGVIAMSLYCGAQTLIKAEFTPDNVLDAIEAGVTHNFLVPTAIQMVITHPRAVTVNWSKFKYLWYGAAPMPVDLMRHALSVTGAQLVQVYGMTETTGTFCSLPPSDHDVNGNERMKSAGKPMPGVEVRIVDEDNRPLPNGEIGEIVVRAPLNMKGYWRNDAKTAETIDADGWLHTGDAGLMDKDGYVFIKDRVKDMIISGGENVYPAEVENMLFSHPDIFEVAVIGIPDEKWGEAVKAVIVPQAGKQVDADAIILWAKEKLAPYKVPKSIDIIAAMPRNASGKILRRELRAPYWNV
ncbi:acyl-CoA synthetase [Sphingorhabdus lutea]|uniref:3-methylmercaptopropionyl-CoA ligase n=1 Tax=Sphingorhabdus lutea TaxID=1913578 RepID=A0A1L3JCZ2_9SPHN|nr:long-chain-fatty-acid--CoA ligase [Sphingorhabdus lutea]APG62959.1 acyl-CoA synthetase [Sphingorhabdus lutea]